MTEDRDDIGRAERAARAYFAGQAGEVGFEPLEPATLRTRVRRHWGRVALAAVACLAVAVAVPLAVWRGMSDPIAATPEPEPGFGWTRTAPAPLGPRFGSVTAWVDREFLVIGGWEGGPCPPGAVCDMAPPTLRDGARYDPAGDTWHPMAAAPAGFGRDFSTAAAWGGALYLTDWSGDGSFWAYYPTDDRWLQHADPPAWGTLVTSELGPVLVVGGQGAVSYQYIAGSDEWTALPAGPLAECSDRQGFDVDGTLLVLAECAEHPETGLKLSTYDPIEGSWSDAVAVAGDVQGRAVHAAGRLVWPDPLTPVSSLHPSGILDVAGQTWREVDASRPPGPLAYRAMVGSTGYLALDGLGLVAANGRLLDVATAGWVDVADAPVADRWDPVRVAGPAAVLDCFGYVYAGETAEAGGSFAPDCHLLSRGTPPSPTQAPPVTPEPSGSPLAWEQVLDGADPVPTDPLLVAANGSYYLIGGYVLDDQVDDVQLTAGSRYDPATGDWQPIADLPDAAVSRPYTLNADVVGTTVYVHISFEETGELWAYDTVADTWTRVGQTDETEHYLGTEDGLVRFRLLGEGTAGPAPQLLGDSGWTDLPPPPLVPEPAAEVFRLGDHEIGLETDGRVVVLDTAGRRWGEPSGQGPTANRSALAAGGAVAFVYPPDNEGEFSPNNKHGLDVVTYRDGTWDHPGVLLEDGGLGSYTGPAAGRWVAVTGNLLDPASGEWLRLPALPGSDYGWDSRIVAATTTSVMTCFPYWADRDRTRTEDGCYLLRLP